MAAKRIRSVLDTEDMTNRQLLRELSKLHKELLYRLCNCLDADVDADNDAIGEAAIDEGILFAARLDRMTTTFRHGGDEYDEFFQNEWGIDRYQREFARRATKALEAAELTA
jgi:hypothetical protein